MFESILVPLDGSPFAESALPVAQEVARRADGALDLVRVRPELPPPIPEALGALPSKTYLEQVADRVRAQASIPVTTTLLESRDVARAVRAHAARTGADLVVMTTHGRGALGRFWLGSVTYELLAILPLPILLVRPPDHRPAIEAGPAFRHMLVPLDGSDLAEEILEPAAALGALFGTRYTLLRVIDEVPIDTPGLDAISLSSAAPEVIDQVREEQARVRAAAAAYLEGVAARFRARGMHADTQVVADFDHGAAVLNVATDPGYDVVGLETQGHRGLARLILGGLARKVIHAAPIPVLVQSAAARRAAPTSP